MPLGLGPRFVVEAAFLIAVAVVAAMRELTTPAIVGVMGGAWLLVAAIEWGVSRRAAARPAHKEAVAPPPVPVMPHEARAPVSEPEPEPEPLSEPIAPEPVTVSAVSPAEEPEPAEPTPPPLPEPVPPVAAERVELAAVPEPEPEPEPARAPVVQLDTRSLEPREWNLWDLERAARDAAGEDAERDEELSFLLMYLRDFAGSDGSLPTRFDALVRDSFGNLLESRAR
jgi:hypothetical protein